MRDLLVKLGEAIETFEDETNSIVSVGFAIRTKDGIEHELIWNGERLVEGIIVTQTKMKMRTILHDLLKEYDSLLVHCSDEMPEDESVTKARKFLETLN